MLSVLLNSLTYPNPTTTDRYLEISQPVNDGPNVVLRFISRPEAENLVKDIQALLDQWPGS